MGDSAEALIDADARIQERLEQMKQERARGNRKGGLDPELTGELESLRLARTDLERQLAVTVHDSRRTQISRALTELDRRMAETAARLSH